MDKREEKFKMFYDTFQFDEILKFLSFLLDTT